MVLLCVMGFGFAWWARLHLGQLWSAFVTRKAGHRIVDTGPYGIVRHPIYTGIIAAAIALALVKGTVIALAGLTDRSDSDSSFRRFATKDRNSNGQVSGEFNSFRIFL